MKKRPERRRTIACPTCGELFSTHGIHLHAERCAQAAGEPEREHELKHERPDQLKPELQVERDSDSCGFIFRD
jgi:hypothetical protein